MKLFVSGKPINFKKRPPKVEAAQAFLDKQRDGELFLPMQLATAIGCSVEYVFRFEALLPGYSYVYHHKKYWAKSKTIKALERKDREQRKRGS